MHGRKVITAVFILEGINSFATTLYFYYIYFFTEKQFGFTKMQNLLLAAAIGLTDGIASILGGKFAQRRGYFAALKAGYAIMAVTIGAGAFVSSLPLHLLIMFVGACGMALTWPALLPERTSILSWAKAQPPRASRRYITCLSAESPAALSRSADFAFF